MNFEAVSPATHFLKLRIVVLLQFYFLIYFVFIGAPLAAHVLLLLLDIRAFSRYESIFGLNKIRIFC